MPLTIPPIPNAAPFAAFSDNVSIFNNSKAREIPARLNAIAQALKEHVNTLWLVTATVFVNGTVVASLNAAITEIETFSNAIETQINAQLAEFEVNLASYLGTGAGYSVDAANAAMAQICHFGVTCRAAPAAWGPSSSTTGIPTARPTPTSPRPTAR